MMSIVTFLFLSLVSVPFTELAPTFTANPPDPFYVLEGNNITLVWQYNLSGSFDDVLLRFVGSTATLTIVDKFDLHSDAKVKESIYQGRIQENINTTQAEVTIFALKRSESGEYEIELVNGNRDRASNRVTVQVQYPPEFNGSSGDVVVVEGTDPSITLECIAIGEPTPNINWTRIYANGSDSGELGTGNQFVLENNRNNSGTYRCRAYNGIGTAPNRTVKVDVHYKPVAFKFTVSKSAVCQGSVVTFDCSADGNPPVDTYQLLENRVPVRNGSKSLGMWSSNMSTAGVFNYKCMANNSVKAAYSMNVTVTVNVPSSIQAIDDMKVVEGDNVNLMCYVSGIPTPMVSWIKPGGPRHNGHMLEVTHINRTHVGEYKCEASNECGNATKTASIDVQYKPENVQFTTSVIDDKACQGNTISLNCSADAKPAVTSYKLFKNDTAMDVSLSGMWSETLTSGGVFVYKCVANNALGTASSTDVTFTANVPSNIEAIQDQNVTEGENLTLTCTASGMPQPKVSWIKPNGQSIAGHVLKFVNMNRSEAGKYKCEVSNECGYATEMATIDVQYEPENVQLTTAVIDDKACQGNTISFNCSADAKPAVTSYKLFRNDTAMAISVTGIWSEPLESGGVFVYKCVATNTLGTASSMNVAITVNVPSSIRAIDLKTVTEGDNLTMMCNVSGMPPPMVFWMKPAGQRHSGCMLNVVNINRGQDGEYKCEASNECGNATKTATIDVHYAARITNISSEQIVNKGDEVSLFCLAEGNPAPTTTWTKFADISGVNFPLTIRGSQDEGLYRCTAENGVGSPVTKFVNMTVRFPAAIVAMGNHTAVKGGTIVLYCNVSGTPPPAVLWTHVKSGETWNQKKWTIEGIQVEELGEYRCDASNKYGGDIKSTFILYEGGFCEKPCTAGKSCRKFGDIYFCARPPGKTGKNCQETEELQENFVVGLKLKEEFKQVYKDLENPETKMLVQNIEKNMMEEFKGSYLVSIKVLKLRQGSIIADLELTFNDSVGQSYVKALLTRAANNGKIGEMEVEDVRVGETFPEPSKDCGTFLEGEDCKKAKPGLIVLCVIGGVVVVAIIVAMIAYGLHKRKKKSRVGSLSNGNNGPRAEPDRFQGNNHGNVSSGYEYDRARGQDHSAEMVTLVKGKDSSKSSTDS